MKLQNLSRGTLLTIALTGILLAVTSAGLLSVSQNIPSSGTVTAVNVGVYSDSACTQNLTSINWGTLAPGDTATRTVYVKNTGNAPITLNMITTNWNPASANGPITITWDVEDWVVGTDNVVTATLTLSVSSSTSDVTDFSIEIVITGTG
jgi:uncharacterized repeat protein (TIGR01451 family)